jgi:hypothetical protein
VIARSLYFGEYGKSKGASTCLISCIRLLDTTHMALLSHFIYYYCVSNFGSYLAISRAIWFVTCYAGISASFADTEIRSLLVK